MTFELAALWSSVRLSLSDRLQCRVSPHGDQSAEVTCACVCEYCSACTGRCVGHKSLIKKIRTT